MKKTFFLFLPFVLILSTCEKKDDGPNPDDPVNIPDTAFLNYIVEHGVDTDGNGLISYAEAAAFEGELNCLHGLGRGQVNSMIGIEAFINLDTLWFADQNVKHLDLTGCFSLRAIRCSASNIESLIISENTNLVSLSAGTTFGGGNSITQIDVSNNTKLELLNLEGNGVTNIDLSSNHVLKKLYLTSNNLTSIDISNNSVLKLIVLDYIKNLEQVCVWTTPFPPDGVEVITQSSPNVYFTTDCSK